MNAFFDTEDKPDAGSGITALALALDGGPTLAWIGDAAGRIARIDAKGLPHWHDTGLDAAITCLATPSDGTRLLAAGAGGEVLVYWFDNFWAVERFLSPAAVVQAAFLDRDRYLTVDHRREGRLWRHRDDHNVWPIAIAADGSATAVGFDRFGVIDGGEHLTLLDALGWKRWTRDNNRVEYARQMAAGERLAYLDGVSGVTANGAYCFLYWDDLAIFDAASGELFVEGPRKYAARAAALSDDATRFVVGTPDGRLLALRPDGEVEWKLQVSDAEIAEIALRPDGGMLGWIDEFGSFGLVDARAGKSLLPRG